MRGLIEGLETPLPVLATLPAIYQDDPFTNRFSVAFDDALASVILTLDNLDAYVDPALAPHDFLEWLAGWVGFPIGEIWPEDRARDLVAHAVELYRWRGTVKGLRDLLTVYTGLEPEIVDTGGVRWATTSGGAASGWSAPPPAGRPAAQKSKSKGKPTKASADTGGGRPPAPHLTVRVRVPKGSETEVRQLEALIHAAKPAHVPHTLEVRG